MSSTRVPFVDGDFDFWPMYDRGEWEPETKAVLEKFLHPGDLFLDIGAWIGPVTMWALDMGAAVVALEPDPVARRSLEKNVAGDAVRILPYALAPATGRGRLAAFRTDFGFGDSQSRLVTDDTPGQKVGVTTVSPSLLFSSLRKPPALVKCDIEGGELACVGDLVANCRVTASPLYISWHEPWWPFTIELRERQAWFNGFDCTPIRGDGWTGFSELLAVPK